MNTPPNPYRPPVAPVTPVDADGMFARSRRLKFVSWTFAGLGTVTAGIAPFTLEQMRTLFDGFGAELPTLSRVALGGMWLWTALAVASIAVSIWITSTDRASAVTLFRMRLALGALVVAEVGFFVFCLIALYLPIFRLGEIV